MKFSERLMKAPAPSSALKDRLDRTSVRSPVDGIVNRVMVKTVGGVVQPGMDLVEIDSSSGNREAARSEDKAG